MLSNKLSITVKEARKILGKKYKNVPDETIQNLIRNLENIARSTIREFPKLNNQEHNSNNYGENEVQK